MKSTVGKFLRMYEEPYFPWASLSGVVYDLGLTAATAATGERFLEESGVGRLFAGEVVQARYAQSPPVHLKISTSHSYLDGAKKRVSIVTDTPPPAPASTTPKICP